VHRISALGETLGRYLAGLDKRVLLIGSGGLSDKLPVPTITRRSSLNDEGTSAREQRLTRLSTRPKLSVSCSINGTGTEHVVKDHCRAADDTGLITVGGGQDP
jgi:hypothetical protein